MAYELVGIEIESPLVNSAGSINDVFPNRILDEVETLAATTIGAITLGSFTNPPQEGKEAKYGSPTYFYDSVLKLTYNNLGLPNIGGVEAIRIAPKVIERAHERGKPVIYSAAPTNGPYGNAIDQVVNLTYDFLAAGIDMVEIDASCPHIESETGAPMPMIGFDSEVVNELSETLQKVIGEGQRVGIKLPPYITPNEKLMIPDIAKILRSQNVFKFITTANSIPDQIPVDINRKPILKTPGGRGGMSGPGTKHYGREQLSLWHAEIGDKLEIISTLGVDSGDELAFRLILGATAAGGVTFLRESTNWAVAVTRMLEEFTETQYFSGSL